MTARSVALLDLNVLLALAWPTHEHHEPAHAWFARHKQRGLWATCSSTRSLAAAAGSERVELLTP